MPNKKIKLTLILSIISVFMITSILSATKFYFDDKKGDVYATESFVKQQVYLDENLKGNYEFKYEGNLKVTDKIGDSSKLKGHYYAYQKPIGSPDPYKLINSETSETEYTRDVFGKMTVDRSYLYPTVRDLPLFKNKNIKIGEEWKSEALEVLDLRSLGASEPYRIPLSVLYRYERDEKFNEKNVAVFTVKYYFEFDMFEKPNPNSNETRPILLTGMFEGEYYWDKDDKAPLFYEAKTVSTFLLKNSQVLEIRTDEYGSVKKIQKNKKEEIVKEVDEERKEEIINDLEEEITEEELDDELDVKDVDEGININLGDILFDTGSYELREESMLILDKLAKILKKYDNFSMVIEGHTDSVGSDRKNKILSENRAKAVEDYLEMRGVNPNSLHSTGYGESKPIASNKSEEGRQQNRRVEINIITNNN